jgi:hypothetical protein
MMTFVETLCLVVVVIAMMASGAASKTLDELFIEEGHFTADGEVVTGVSGKGDQVVLLNLANDKLTGTIPAKIGKMSSLRSL